MAFWEDTQRYLYLPRLRNRDVLAQAIRSGAASRDFFGTAYGQTGDKFDGFHFGDGNVQVDDTLLADRTGGSRAVRSQHQETRHYGAMAQGTER